MRERNIENYLVERVKEAGGEIRKVKWIGRRGCPDRFVGFSTRVSNLMFPYCLVELKRPGKKLDDHQKREIKKLEKVGLYTFVIDTKQKVNKFIKYFTGK